MHLSCPEHMLGDRPLDEKLAMIRAADRGALNIILVPVFGPPRLRVPGSEEEIAALERGLLVVSLNEIRETLGDVPITVVLEPLNRGETHFLVRPTVAAGICAQAGSEDGRIATMVDTYHCFQEGLEIADEIKGTRDHLALLHYSDSARGLPGEGAVDFGAATAALAGIGYEGWIGWECRQIVTDEDVEALAASVRHVREAEG